MEKRPLKNVDQKSAAEKVDLNLFKIEELEERLEMAQLSTSAVGPNSVCWIGDPGCGGGG
ncbi:hypothetical protein [Chitinophaga sp. XS-30]|uniref:hypothetical protein n=1 Tax=Chitinophaga sp. XS-30 TaxID=2604421 RepID=UPI0011DD74CE|nr:hypothetical protein [Chitinophaga sp. XS-30]QEH42004.1 hypothetical protein FW415_14430 [Chitinophaga sp. XS-30]